MMKTTICLMLFIAATLHNPGRQPKIDSLKRLLRIAKEDTVKADILLQLGRHWIATRPDSSLLMVQQGLQLSRKLGYLAGEARGLNLVGLAYSIKGNLPKAMSYYLKALKINERRNDRLGMAKNLGNIANIYDDQEDHRKQIDYLLKSKALLESIHNEEVLAIALGNLGSAYFSAGMLDSARMHALQGFKLSTKVRDTVNIAFSTAVLGDIHKKMGNPRIALTYYRKAISYQAGLNEDDALSGLLSSAAEVFRDLNQADSSLYYARRSFVIAEQGGFPQQLLLASKFLTAYFESRGRSDSAFRYQKVYIAAKDSLFSQEKMKQIQELSFAEQQRQEKIAKQKLLGQQKKKQNLQMAGIAVFLPVFFVFILYLSHTRVKPRTVEFLCLLVLLLLFEFISMLISPLVKYAEQLTTNSPATNLLIHIGVASLLARARKPIDRWVKGKLLNRKPTDASIPGIDKAP